MAAALGRARRPAWAQTHGAGGGHTGADASPDTAHDRQSWDAGRKADEAVNRAAGARQALVGALEASDEEGWCPRTVAEREALINALACFLATREIWRNYTYDVYPPGPVAFAAEFKGRADGDEASQKRHSRAEKMKQIFKDVKELRDDTLELLRACAPANGVALAGDALDAEVRKRAEQKKGHELALIGLAPLVISDCPECRPRVRLLPGPVILGR